MWPWKPALVVCCTLPRTIMVDFAIMSSNVSCCKVDAWMDASNAANTRGPPKIRIVKYVSASDSPCGGVEIIISCRRPGESCVSVRHDLDREWSQLSFHLGPPITGPSIYDGLH